ncbi:unnamed protein product [Peronospora belbahrii]|uniref:Serine aminopeptidase S33 domain-containing protein n=1 Tax=Peronospora belbahrii TaxID=622444 RepID=A0ABN8CPI3_9STRA|nr:unnamed protein product [Peronospora belbahrii]
MPTTKALSVRSRPVSCFDDSLLDENTKEASKQQKAIKTTMSLRSRHASCFEDLLASDPTSLEGCKSRVVCTRPASNPAKLISQANSSALSPSSSEEQSTDAERSARRREKTPTVGKGKAKRSKSLAKRKIGHSRSPSDNDDTLAHGHALFDKGHDRKAIRSLSDNEISTCSSDMKVTSSLMKQSKSFSRLRQYEGKFKNRRGQSLLYFSMFPPEKLAMRGIVLHLHGMGDHCRRNTALYERHCKEGFGVITYDLLNHGESEYDKYKIRAHVTNFDDFVEDTNDFITFAKSNIYKVALRYWRKHHHPRHPHGREKKRQNAPELPLIISGASFGSLVGLHTVLSGEHKFHAAVWASPTIGVTWAPMLRIQWKFARPLVAALPTAKVIPAIQHNFRSRDPNFLKKYQDDPLTSSDMITPCSGYQSLHAMIRLQEEKKISDSDSPFCGIPMLFLAGSEDRISDQQAAIKFYTRMESLDKEFKLFDGLYHMIYEEPEKEDVLKYLVNWLHKRFPLETRHSTNSHVT